MSEIANCLVKLESSNLSSGKKMRLCERISGILDETKTINQRITIFQKLMHIWFNSHAILEEIYKTLNNENFCFLHDIYIQIDSENKTSRISLFKHVSRKFQQNNVDFDVNIYKSNQIDACKSNIMAIPIAFQINNSRSSHANMLIINTKAKTVDHFEPHGTYSGSNKIPQELINTQIDKLIDMLVDRSIYTVTHPDETCPNLQGFVRESEWSGTCAMFSMFYAIKRLLNPEKSHSEINREIEVIFRTSRNPVNTIIYITKSLVNLLNINETDMTVNSRQINPRYHFQYPDGTVVFFGAVVNGVPDGIGKIVFPDKTELYGNFDNGELNESARMTLPDKTEIDGFYSNGSMNGNGKIKYTNGDIYAGDITNNKKNGFGIMKYKKGDIYEGNWIDDKRTGQGTMKYKNGDLYKGNWFDNIPRGQGTMQYANGNVYEGNWLEYDRSGQGVMKYANGKVYEGNWIDNEPDYEPDFAPSSPDFAPSASNEIDKYAPSSPDFAPSSPDFAPSSPDYAPSSPDYAPSSPDYAPEKKGGKTKKRRINKKTGTKRRKGKCYRG